MKRINGSVTANQTLTGALQYYIVFAKSDMAFSSPQPNPSDEEELLRGINILNTGELVDQSQKNYEILFQSIGLRSMPIIVGEVVAVEDLTVAGSPTLSGEGFIWKFAVEQNSAFEDFETMDPVGLLVKELDGVFISSGVRITTTDSSYSGVEKNIEFVRMDNL